jgi:serine/threonine protein kinase
MKPCPNLVGFYGGDLVKETASKTIVIVLMEMCDTGTLFDEMVSKQDTGFKEEHLLRIVECIAKGIAGLHGIGYAHRDIKIENVLQGKDGTYKLCDFGSCTNRTVDFGAMPQSDYGLYEDELEKNTTPMYRPPEIVDPFLRYRVN